ncbi:unannotated protein [freshwater metagenome]|uniref:Unannotated protein n=1 Tax=freshwater metagenome TaxID=449393 RepID=A0A6J6JL43_9ZZZZ
MKIARNSVFADILRLSNAPAREATEMSTKPSFGLRFYASAIALSMVFTLVGSQPAQAAVAHPSTVSFLAKSMVEGKVLDGPVAGTPDFSLTLEAMMQLKAGGRELVRQLPAVRHMLSTRTQPFGTLSRGYLFNQDEAKSLKPGLAGKFLFTSEVLDVPNNAIRFEAFRRLAASINSRTGEISGATAGSVDYAWVAMGLNSYQEFTLANRVVQFMLTLQNTDGGFGETDPLVSTPTATGLALQAINYRQTFGNDQEDAARSAAEKKSVSFLLATDLEENHWGFLGEPSVTATAYAVMGLKAFGARKTTLARYTNWLKAQLSPKGGFVTSASNGEGDKFATAQSYVPLIGKSYLDLLP